MASTNPVAVNMATRDANSKTLANVATNGYHGLDGKGVRGLARTVFTVVGSATFTPAQALASRDPLILA